MKDFPDIDHYFKKWTRFLGWWVSEALRREGVQV